MYETTNSSWFVFDVNARNKLFIYQIIKAPVLINVYYLRYFFATIPRYSLDLILITATILMMVVFNFRTVNLQAIEHP